MNYKNFFLHHKLIQNYDELWIHMKQKKILQPAKKI